MKARAVNRGAILVTGASTGRFQQIYKIENFGSFYWLNLCVRYWKGDCIVPRSSRVSIRTDHVLVFLLNNTLLEYRHTVFAAVRKNVDGDALMREIRISPQKGSLSYVLLDVTKEDTVESSFVQVQTNISLRKLLS